MSSHLSEHDAGFEDFLVLDSHSIDHEPEYSQSSRSAGGISRPKQWSTSLALVIIQGCADYCTLMNWDRFDLNEASVDWEQWSSIVKWPAEPRPIGMCIKKIKDIHHQWKTPTGSLAKILRAELAKEPLVFGPGATMTTRGVATSRKRSSPSTMEEVADQQPTAKRPKLGEIVQILESEAQVSVGELETAEQRLLRLRRQLDFIYEEIQQAVEDVQSKTAEQRRLSAILQAAHSPLPPE